MNRQTFMWTDEICVLNFVTLNGRTFFFFTLFCSNFSPMGQPLVFLNIWLYKLCYLCKKYIKGKEKVSNIILAEIDKIKTAEKLTTHKKWKSQKSGKHMKKHRISIFIWSGLRLKMIHVNPSKTTKLMCHSNCRRDFTNDINISRYNQQKIVWVITFSVTLLKAPILLLLT